MKKFFTMLPAALALTTACTMNAETLDYRYDYTGDANLSAMTAGSLQVGEFTDARDAAGPDMIEVNGSTYHLQAPLTDLLESAFRDAFTDAQAPLSETGNIVFQAEILELDVQPTAEGLQLQLRSDVSVNRGGRQLWQSVLFSRVTTDSDDLTGALDAGLDRLMQELFRDDYFRMALGIY